MHYRMTCRRDLRGFRGQFAGGRFAGGRFAGGRFAGGRFAGGRFGRRRLELGRRGLPGSSNPQCVREALRQRTLYISRATDSISLRIPSMPFFNCINCLPTDADNFRQTLTIQQQTENGKYEEPLDTQKIKESQRQDHHDHLPSHVNLFRSGLHGLVVKLLGRLAFLRRHRRQECLPGPS